MLHTFSASTPYRSHEILTCFLNRAFHRLYILLSIVPVLTQVNLGVTHAQPIEQDFDGITFVKIQGDTFNFGSPQDQPLRRGNEQQRVISLTHSFWISKYEISQGEWINVMGVNPSSFKSLGPDMSAPVETVSWHQAKSFVTRMNQNAGDAYYRLPTEAEWEYVAKADTTSSWSFGEHTQTLSDYTHRDGLAQPRYRGLKSPNQWGIYDLYGNVYEWCEDWYQSRRPESAGGCPPEYGSYKVIRGGSNTSIVDWLRSSSRNFAHPGRKGYYIGIRLVRVDDPAQDPYQPDAYCEGDHRNNAPDTDTLPGLTIAEVDPNTPAYDRDDWTHWIDEDEDCINTRHEVLLAESLIPVNMVDDDPCRVDEGQWYDPYTGLSFTSASALDVDHMVPLANAHASGAWAWSAAERRAYANDQIDEHHLIAVQAAANRSKGSRGPEAWQPPNAAHHCEYARRWITIKSRWGLSSTQAEWFALLGMLDTCPEGRPIITDPPDLDEDSPPSPPPSPPHPGDAVNCGDFNHYDDAYAWYIQYFNDFGDIARLDSDGDGIPCASLPGAPQ